ncbi:DUF4190 domain-containing protein [Novipirellula sp. SH528]|uniref:DUF4190 domain-containing protein n=1 Tax=Novipirellula sp. SH528 TaxID=3454466 RepID=UPI003FA0995C
MPFCGACNSFIIGGGKSEDGKRYCNDKCLEHGRTINYVGDIPDEIVAQRAWQMRDATCPRCGGPGPVDYVGSRQVISVIILTRTSDTTVFGCKRCGNRTTIQSTAISMLTGWWGFPWGLIMTPIVVVSNIVSLLQPSPLGPSATLLEAAKLDMAAQLRHRVEAGPQASPLSSLSASDDFASDFPTVQAAVPSSPQPGNYQPTHYADAAYTPAATSGLAITSLVLSLISIFAFCLMGLSLFTSIVAVATGHMALKQIKRSHGQLTGDGMAITGLVIGYVMLLLSVTWVAILVISLSQADPRVRRNVPQRPFPGLEAHDPNPPAQPVLPKILQPPKFEPPAVRPNSDRFEPSFPAPMTPAPLPKTPPLHDPFEPPVSPMPPGARDVMKTNPFDPPPRRPAARPPAVAKANPEEDITDPNVVHVFSNMGWTVKSLAFSPDKRFLVAGKLDAKLIVLDLTTGEQVFEINDLQNEMSQVTSVAFSRDGKRIIAAGYKGAIASWAINDAGQLSDKQALASQAKHVQTLVVSPASGFLISGSSRGQLLWQPIVSPGAPNSRQIEALPRAVLAIHLPKSGLKAIASDGQSLVAVDLKTAKLLGERKLQKAYPHAAAFSSDGSRLAITSGYEINVFNTATQSHELKIDTDHDIQWSVGFMPDGKRIYSGGRGRITFWDAESGEPTARLNAGGVISIKTIVVSDDSQWLATIPEAAAQTLRVFKIPD